MPAKKQIRFDQSVQETHAWINDVSDAMDDPRRTVAYHALRGTLFALRDRLPPDEVFDLSAQLPLLIRGLYFEGYRPSGKPEKMHRDEFFDRVRNELESIGGANVESAVRAVFRVLADRLDQGESDDIRNALPDDLRDLWPSPSEA